MKNVFPEKYKAILFHLCLWGIWLYLPLSNAREEELQDRFFMVISFIFVVHIPMFLLNTEWLIPKILHKKGATSYLWALLILIAIFSIFNGFLSNLLFEHWTTIKPHGRNYFWNIVPSVLRPATLSRSIIPPSGSPDLVSCSA